MQNKLHIIVGEYVDTLETYIEDYQVQESYVRIRVKAPRLYQDTIFLDDKATKRFLPGGYKHLKPEQFEGMPVLVEYWGDNPRRIAFRDLDPDEDEGPMGLVGRLHKNGF